MEITEFFKKLEEISKTVSEVAKEPTREKIVETQGAISELISDYYSTTDLLEELLLKAESVLVEREIEEIEKEREEEKEEKEDKEDKEEKEDKE